MSWLEWFFIIGFVCFCALWLSKIYYVGAAWDGAISGLVKEYQQKLGRPPFLDEMKEYCVFDRISVFDYFWHYLLRGRELIFDFSTKKCIWLKGNQKFDN